MPNIGFPEILLILVVALVVFGPRKLPELGKSLGAGLREFRRTTQGLKDEFDSAVGEADPNKILRPGQTQVQVATTQPQVVRAADMTAPQPVAAQAVAAQPQSVTVQPVAAAEVAQPQPIRQD